MMLPRLYRALTDWKKILAAGILALLLETAPLCRRSPIFVDVVER
jgi:hypothetical protein